jgi:hypothetical protein
MQNRQPVRRAQGPEPVEGTVLSIARKSTKGTPAEAATAQSVAPPQSKASFFRASASRHSGKTTTVVSPSFVLLLVPILAVEAWRTRPVTPAVTPI